MTELLSIGAVAAATGVSVSALRYYDELDIIQEECLVDGKLAELAEKRRRLDEMIELLTRVRECGCEVVSTCTYGTTTC